MILPDEGGQVRAGLYLFPSPLNKCSFGCCNLCCFQTPASWTSFSHSSGHVWSPSQTRTVEVFSWTRTFPGSPACKRPSITTSSPLVCACFMFFYHAGVCPEPHFHFQVQGSTAFRCVYVVPLIVWQAHRKCSLGGRAMR